MRIQTKEDRRDRIKFRIRKRLRGTAEQPRLSVFRSGAAHLRAGDRRPGWPHAGRRVEPRADRQGGARRGRAGRQPEGRRGVGQAIAERLKEKGITRVVFDRNGFLYHGRVRAVAEAARQAGLQF